MTSARQALDLFRTEAPRLRQFLRRFGASLSPEDIAQESFARLCMADRRPIQSPRAYLFRTARNLALNELRRQHDAPMGDLDALVIAAPTADPEQELIAREEQGALETAIAALPEHLRDALVLHRLERKTLQDVAHRLGVSRKTVQRYIAEALARCHAALGAEASDDP